MATIEIDGVTLEAENGKMIIEVADDAKIHIPRFCYHKKLSVAANCRMCLVEVENGRKPVPACATPITNGMKVYTKSKEALRSQKAVMEFLLINHPLDCPICDQGGECELQDVSMGFGEGSSHYEDVKRSVDDENLGSLIETEMTRCIHCTRCVRFGTEIAGLRELGAMGRGENMRISSFVNHSMTSEVSANIIDLCPVGALTNKPYRFTARAWELIEHPAVSPHDCLGTNIQFHVRRNEVMRVVPRENESINETWISDRDRFSYLGHNSEYRAGMPRIKQDGQWKTVDWATALNFASDGLARVIKHHGANEVAGFASHSATLEELYLFQKWLRGLGVTNIDHRLQQSDFSDEARRAGSLENTIKFSDLDGMDAIFLVGCNIMREVPLAGLRVRKAFRNGAELSSLSIAAHEYYADITNESIVSPFEMIHEIANILKALFSDDKAIPESVQKLLIGLEPTDIHRRIATSLSLENAVIISGAIVENHPQAGDLRALLDTLCEFTGAKRIHFPVGGNSHGAALAGVLPHKLAGGKLISEPGLNVQESIRAKLKAYILFGVEPAYDFNDPHHARQSMIGAEFVVALSPFYQKSMEDYVDVILPIATFAETSGTYINVDGLWQTVKGAVAPFGEARPAWKVFRVLGNLFHLSEFDYLSSEDVLSEVHRIHSLSEKSSYQRVLPEVLPGHNNGLVRCGEWPLYGCDAVVRRSDALLASKSADSASIKMHPLTAHKYHLGEYATVLQNEIEIILPVVRDDRMAQEVVWVLNALPETVDLGQSFGTITVKR